jgi:hypothetical protein
MSAVKWVGVSIICKLGVLMHDFYFITQRRVKTFTAFQEPFFFFFMIEELKGQQAVLHHAQTSRYQVMQQDVQKQPHA